jgi:hypothetical protein
VPIRTIKIEIPAKRNLFSTNALTHDREHFRSSYAGSPPWDIGKPQPAFQAAADKVVGSVLDAGCGTGEHALFFDAAVLRNNSVRVRSLTDPRDKPSA